MPLLEALSGPESGKKLSNPMKADEAAADFEPIVPTKYWIVLGMLGTCLVAYWAWDLLQGPESPDSLAARALAAGTPEERMLAAAQLSLIKEPKVIRSMRRLLAESHDPKVQIVAINRLSAAGDVESTLPFYAAMDHQDGTVREAAYNAVLNIYGGALPENLEYQPGDPADKRARVTRQLKEIFEDGKAGKRRSEVSIAAPTPTPIPAPAPPPTAAPSPIATDAGPVAQSSNYPAIDLVVWMCRLLAIVVLIADVAGAISLLVGEKVSGPQRRDKAGKNPTEELIAAALARGGPGLWTKVAMLVGGATLVVALLYAGELLYLAGRFEQAAGRVEQTAIRVEQKIEYLKVK
jgi:hypothetical protein